MDTKIWRERWEERSRVSDAMARDGVGGLTEAERHALGGYVLDRLDLRPDQRVLEVGCGTGWYLRQIEERAAEVVGTDISGGMLSHHTGKATLIECEASEVDFPDESFDRILMFGVSHYFPDMAHFGGVIRNLFRMLRRDGLIFIGDVYFSPSLSAEYTYFDVAEVYGLLVSMDTAFSVNAQPRVKRDFHRPFGLKNDIIIRKD
ncbi:MAG TPA: class I SAM-dependent methyltransferase [Azospirillaceae bacterium]|nr:class I SAM-dependent methyltransferase [Azospirillaceae bacterium]